MRKRRATEPAKSRESGVARLSITIPADDYTDLKKTADRKRVSVAWVVRDAVHEYLKNQAPLFRS